MVAGGSFILARAHIELTHAYIILTRACIILARAHIELTHAYIILARACIILALAYIMIHPSTTLRMTVF